MENKYYYPSKEEIRVGWEGEMNNALGYEDSYTPIKIGYKEEGGAYTTEISDVIIMMDDRYGEVRVPFLSKEQIEAEGWKYTAKSIDVWFEKEDYFDMRSWTSYKAVLQYGLHDQCLRIFVLDYEDEYTLFQGKCPDINTFRLICKLIGV